MTIKRCSQGSSRIVKRFLGKHFLIPVKNCPKNDAKSGKWGTDIRFYVRDPEKVHPCTEPPVSAYFALKSVQGPWLGL